MSNNCVLVTGGAGYIGSQTCKALSQAGFMPVVYDNLSRGHRHAVRWGPLVEGDLRDSHKLIEALRFYRASSVIHFAALKVYHCSCFILCRLNLYLACLKEANNLSLSSICAFPNTIILRPRPWMRDSMPAQFRGGIVTIVSPILPSSGSVCARRPDRR